MTTEIFNIKKIQGKKNFSESKVRSLQEIFEIMELSDLNQLILMRKKALVENIYLAEISEYLGYEKSERFSSVKKNYRNGFFYKIVEFKEGPMELKVPRARRGDFEPLIIKKSQMNAFEIEDRLLMCCVDKTSKIDVEENIRNIYREVSSGKKYGVACVKKIVEKFYNFLRSWQKRELKSEYSMILMYKYPINDVFRNRRLGDYTVFICIGVESNGNAEIIGIYINENNDEKGWNSIIQNFRKRGVNDVWCFSVDNIPELRLAIREYYPNSSYNTSFCYKILGKTKGF